MVGDASLPPFSAVVLAGGHSRRFGEENKAVAVLDGSTFIGHVIDAVRPVADGTPIVAVKSDIQRNTIEDGLTSACDPTFAFDRLVFDGPVAGLYGALSAVDCEWLFLTGCDMPRLSSDAIAWLANQLKATSSPPDALVPVHHDGSPEPLHAFYRREAVAAARNQLPPDAGLRTLVDALPDSMNVPIRSAPADVSLDSSVENVNTRREYRKVRGHLGH